ncbi:olfactory receptor 8D1-like [Xenopus tropicalis]|uniref:Olfactory receptor n=1 Tax=Xenopus tropicalis TaxID=8364 RepID=A0A8J0R2M7_XENTR|nr:olfactory receptor 8D1-like [Xenopus tropicalis]|eukprot:XP_004917526.1 PREDICTED: olfactory receptor 8D1-like [Xenopus tropicalis]
MPAKNQSSSSGFILQGFSDYPDIQIPLFCLFLLIYLLTLQGNVLILIVIYQTSLLHIPMYFFLCNLAFIDLCASSVSQPKLLSILLGGDNKISFGGCMTQLYFFMSLTCAEFVSLTAMAYDRYVAICNPLRYLIVMNRRVCVMLVITCWMISFVEPVSHTVLISHLPFCSSWTIDHFFCDLSILNMSCGSTFCIQLLTFVFGSLVALPACALTVASYTYIISTIIKIHSATGRKKAFSTCTSHLTVVILFYGSTLITYMRPTSQYSTTLSKPFSFLYTALIPLINPFIYTLRNKDIKRQISNKIKFQRSH